MDFQEVKAFLESDEGKKEEIMSYVQGLNPITLDKVKAFMQSDKDGKSWLDSEKDKHLNKGIETFKSNQLPKLVQEEYRKKHPEKDEKDLALENLKAEIEQMKQEKERESRMNYALKLATEQKISVDMTDLLVGSDDDTTKANFEKFKGVIDTIRQEIADEALKGAYKPFKTNDSNTTINPWKKETFNLTMQGQILRDNPELAKQLQESAGIK